MIAFQNHFHVLSSAVMIGEGEERGLLELGDRDFENGGAVEKVERFGLSKDE